MSWLNLEGKAVIVTGGASGIGKAIVEELLADGAQVAVCDMNPQSPVFEGNTENMIYIHTDVTSRQSVEDMVKQTVDTFGKLDAIVNNAGINIPRMLVDEGKQYELDETVWDKVMNVNLKGLYFCAQRSWCIRASARSSICLRSPDLRAARDKASTRPAKTL